MDLFSRVKIATATCVWTTVELYLSEPMANRSDSCYCIRRLFSRNFKRWQPGKFLEHIPLKKINYMLVFLNLRFLLGGTVGLNFHLLVDSLTFSNQLVKRSIYLSDYLTAAATIWIRSLIGHLHRISNALRLPQWISCVFKQVWLIHLGGRGGGEGGYLPKLDILECHTIKKMKKGKKKLSLFLVSTKLS